MYISLFSGFGTAFGIPPNILTEKQINLAIKNLPVNVKNVLESNHIDVIKHISKRSGLLQTEPLFRGYDFSERDRKILMSFASKTEKRMFKEEKKMFSLFKKFSKKSDFTFYTMETELKMRIEFRKHEVKNITKLLSEVKFKPKQLEQPATVQ